MSLKAGWGKELNNGRAQEDPVVYAVADGDERVGGWDEFDKLRDEALAYVDQFFTLRDEVERVGRQRGL